MADTLRKRWQNFKTDYPDFEKNQAFKADLSSQLDKWQQAQDKSRIARDAFLNSLRALEAQLKASAQISRAYKQVLKDLKPKHPKIETDFDEVFEFDLNWNVLELIDTAIFQCQKITTDIKGITF